MKKIILLVVAISLIGCGSDLPSVNGFLGGQSNATPELASAIQNKTLPTLLQCNHGGQAIETWIEEQPYHINADMAVIGNNELDYIVWFQGESNVGNFEYYANKLFAILGQYTNQAIPVIIIQVYSSNSEVAQTMEPFRTYQANMCNQYPNFYLIDSSDCSRYDSFHLDAAGIDKLSTKIAELLKMLGGY